MDCVTLVDHWITMAHWKLIATVAVLSCLGEFIFIYLFCLHPIQREALTVAMTKTKTVVSPTLYQ